jgi:hypothetical protein
MRLGTGTKFARNTVINLKKYKEKRMFCNYMKYRYHKILSKLIEQFSKTYW